MVACHLAEGHLQLQPPQPHSWDIEAMLEDHRRLMAAMDQLAARFPHREIVSVDAQPAYPIIAHDIDSQGQRGQPYRAYELPGGPWVRVRYTDGEEWAIWKATGAVWKVSKGGAIEEDEPSIPGADG